MGIALDCCTKPSHDLGRSARFNAAFGSLRKHFLSSGIRTVITACPNCHQVFKRYGGPLLVENAYELLSHTEEGTFQRGAEEVAVHDPCAVRFDTGLHTAIRKLVKKSGARITELPSSGRKTLCCGEGGAVGHLHPGLSRRWTETRCRQTKGRRLVTYCAGCAGFLNRVTPTEHILDLLFPRETGRPFGMKVSRPPMTYWNRIRLKWHLKRHLPWQRSGNRPFDRKKVIR
jgi:Fe-S oxidoreductase